MSIEIGSPGGGIAIATGGFSSGGIGGGVGIAEGVGISTGVGIGGGIGSEAGGGFNSGTGPFAEMEIGFSPSADTATGPLGESPFSNLATIWSMDETKFPGPPQANEAPSLVSIIDSPVRISGIPSSGREEDVLGPVGDTVPLFNDINSFLNPLITPIDLRPGEPSQVKSEDFLPVRPNSGSEIFSAADESVFHSIVSKIENTPTTAEMKPEQVIKASEFTMLSPTYNNPRGRRIDAPGPFAVLAKNKRIVPTEGHKTQDKKWQKPATGEGQGAREVTSIEMGAAAHETTEEDAIHDAVLETADIITVLPFAKQIEAEEQKADAQLVNRIIGQIDGLMGESNEEETIALQCISQALEASALQTSLQQEVLPETQEGGDGAKATVDIRNGEEGEDREPTVRQEPEEDEVPFTRDMVKNDYRVNRIIEKVKEVKADRENELATHGTAPDVVQVDGDEVADKLWRLPADKDAKSIIIPKKRKDGSISVLLHTLRNKVLHPKREKTLKEEIKDIALENSAVGIDPQNPEAHPQEVEKVFLGDLKDAISNFAEYRTRKQGMRHIA